MCRAAWPCDCARTELSEEYADDRTALAMLMSKYLMDAVAETAEGSPDVLYARFVGWIRDRRD